MADRKVSGPGGGRPDGTSVPVSSKSFTGAASTWGTQAGGSASDDLVLSPPCRAIRVSVGGNLSVVYATGDADVIPASDGELVQGQFMKIVAATSTVTGISIKW